MTDTANDQPGDDSTAPTDSTTPPSTPNVDPGTLPESAPDWQALAQKWEKQAKNDRASLDALKKKMQGLLTPEQVQDQAQAAAEAAAAAARASGEALRLRVALEKGLPPDLVDRLIGEDRTELEADADKLLALVAARAGAPRIPDAGAGTGRTPDNKQPPDANALLRAAAGVA